MNEIMERRAADVATNAQTQALVGRQSQEVQAAVFMAKQFPRDAVSSLQRIKNTCQRKSLAEVAVYEYPRGGTKVTGPSIRLAEAVAQAWGNIDTGVIELERKNGESVAMAYAWDLETNYRQTKTFSVPHIRSTKKGNAVLTDPRDIYELVANQGSRRQRACILGVIPGDVIDEALAICEKTLSNADEALSVRIDKMASLFESEFGITVDMLEKRIGMNISAFTEQSIKTLRGIYISLRDGMSSPEDYFDMDAPTKTNTKAKPADKPAPKKAGTGQLNMDELDDEATPQNELTDEEKTEIIAQEMAEAEAEIEE